MYKHWDRGCLTVSLGWILQMILHFLTLQNALKMVDDRIQKNQQNGQTLMLALEKVCPILCPVRCALRMVLKARWLNHPNSMSLGCYRTKKHHWCTWRPTGWPPSSENQSRNHIPASLPLTWKSIPSTRCKFGHVSSWMKQAKAWTISVHSFADKRLLLHVSPWYIKGRHGQT